MHHGFGVLYELTPFMFRYPWILPPLLALILRCLQSGTKPVLPLLVDIVLKTASRIDMAARQKGDDIEVMPFAQSTYDRELRWSQG